MTCNSRKIDEKIEIQVKRFMSMNVVDQCRVLHDILRSKYFTENELNRLLSAMAQAKITANRSKLYSDF